MNRREILRNMLIATGGMAFLPACNLTEEDVKKTYNRLNVTPTDKNVIRKLCALIIPLEQKYPGLDESIMRDFVLMMVDDVFSPEQQKRYQKGLKSLNTLSKVKFGTSFLKMEKTKAKDVYYEFEKTQNSKEPDMNDVKYFLQQTKNLTILGYTTSKHFLTDIIPYELVPGHFSGKVSIDSM